MKKISLQTKLEDCHVHQRYINTITIGSKKTISDLVYSQKYELRKIRGVGKKCIQAWEDFLKVYGLHIGMTEYEIYQYEYEETSNSSSEETSNCSTESSVDWEQREKFDPKTLKPYDKVLGRDLLGKGSNWICTLFSHYDKGADFYPCYCAGAPFSVCIPYNDDTKHLVGTNEEAPEFYRYWEE